MREKRSLQADHALQCFLERRTLNAQIRTKVVSLGISPHCRRMEVPVGSGGAVNAASSDLTNVPSLTCVICGNAREATVKGLD